MTAWPSLSSLRPWAWGQDADHDLEVLLECPRKCPWKRVGCLRQSVWECMWGCLPCTPHSSLCPERHWGSFPGASEQSPAPGGGSRWCRGRLQLRESGERVSTPRPELFLPVSAWTLSGSSHGHGPAAASWGEAGDPLDAPRVETRCSPKFKEVLVVLVLAGLKVWEGEKLPGGLGRSWAWPFTVAGPVFPALCLFLGVEQKLGPGPCSVQLLSTQSLDRRGICPHGHVRFFGKGL